MLAACASGPAYAPSRPPGPPLFPSEAKVPWTTRADFNYSVRAAYGPVTYSAQGLPEGLALDPGSGEIRGRFRRAGSYVISVRAVNALGSASARLPIEVTGDTWGAVVSAPSVATAGAPVEIGYCAFDGARGLDFIDVSDLTTGKVMDRLAAGEGQKAVWQGAYWPVFAQAGPHDVLLRFVRVDASGGYVFLDRGFRVDVAR
jgi:hypothetical protein